jgi:hypothetical protein
VEILEGYRRRDRGVVAVLGTDPAQPTSQWRARIGIVLQTCELPRELTVWELVERFAGYRPVGETLDLVGLGERRDARAGTLALTVALWSQTHPGVARRCPDRGYAAPYDFTWAFVLAVSRTQRPGWWCASATDAPVIGPPCWWSRSS